MLLTNADSYKKQLHIRVNVCLVPMFIRICIHTHIHTHLPLKNVVSIYNRQAKSCYQCNIDVISTTKWCLKNICLKNSLKDFILPIWTTCAHFIEKQDLAIVGHLKGHWRDLQTLGDPLSRSKPGVHSLCFDHCGCVYANLFSKTINSKVLFSPLHPPCQFPVMFPWRAVIGLTARPAILPLGTHKSIAKCENWARTRFEPWRTRLHFVSL